MREKREDAFAVDMGDILPDGNKDTASASFAEKQISLNGPKDDVLKIRLETHCSSLICFATSPSPRAVGFAKTCVTPFEEEENPPSLKIV